MNVRKRLPLKKGFKYSLDIMWPKSYKDYPVDDSLIQEQVEPGDGIIGCEMHEINGWGENFHRNEEQKPGFLRSLWNRLIGGQ